VRRKALLVSASRYVYVASYFIAPGKTLALEQGLKIYWKWLRRPDKKVGRYLVHMERMFELES